MLELMYNLMEYLSYEVRNRLEKFGLTPSILHIVFFFFNDPAPTEISPLPLHAALPISDDRRREAGVSGRARGGIGIIPPPRHRPDITGGTGDERERAGEPGNDDRRRRARPRAHARLKIGRAHV